MIYPELTGGALEALVAYHAKLNDHVFGASGAKLSDKAQSAQNIIRSGAFGCNGPAVADLVSALLEERVTATEAQAICVGVMITSNSHRGGAIPGDVVMVLGASQQGGLYGQTISGKRVQDMTGGHYRPSTVAGIRAFLQERHGGGAVAALAEDPEEILF